MTTPQNYQLFSHYKFMMPGRVNVTVSHWEAALTLSLDSCCMNIHSGVQVHSGLLCGCYKEHSLRQLPETWQLSGSPRCCHHHPHCFGIFQCPLKCLLQDRVWLLSMRPRVLCAKKTKLYGSPEWLILSVSLMKSSITLDLCLVYNRRRLSPWSWEDIL